MSSESVIDLPEQMFSTMLTWKEDNFKVKMIPQKEREVYTQKIYYIPIFIM